MTPQSLFPEPEPSIRERAESIDAEILALLIGKSGGPFGLHLSKIECQVLSAVRFHRGVANAITIREMRDTRPGCAKLTDREVKEAVRSLRVTYCLPIGSSKMGSAGGGYFLMISSEDYAILNGQILDQILAEFQVLKAVNRKHSTLERLGQLQMEINKAAQEVA
jgi:hypothetical protein